MTAKGIHAYEAALRLQAPWVNMLGQGFDPKKVEQSRRVLDGLRQRLEHYSPDAADKKSRRR
jgi:hypothetical protein